MSCRIPFLWTCSESIFGGPFRLLLPPYLADPHVVEHKRGPAQHVCDRQGSASGVSDSPRRELSDHVSDVVRGFRPRAA